MTIASGSAAAADQNDPSFACLAEPGTVQLIDGFFTDEFEPHVEARKRFDARGASFEYPETISHSMVSVGEKGGSGADDMCWAGGFFTASRTWHDLNISWEESKQGYDDTASDRGEMNNTTSVTSYEDRMTWTGLHVYNMHDGMRTNNTFNNWTIRHVWLDYIRDDCLENDSSYSGVLYDVLFDGCYSGISNQSGDGRGEAIVMDKVLLRMEPMPYPYKWDTKDDPVIYVNGYGDVPFGHGSIFKGDEENLPQFSITNSVFLQEYDAEENIFPPASRVATCENNTIIWLDGQTTAPTYLLDAFPGCFTIITDYSQGKALWREKVADWHARHPEVGLDRKPLDPGEYSWPRYAASGPGGGNTKPVAEFSASCVDLQCTFDGSDSTDDGAIIGNDWEFGDGVTDNGDVVTHTYDAAGSYYVTLTVTDDGGATDSETQAVTVTAPGAPIPPSDPTTMHVGDLDGNSTSQGPTWTAIVTVLVEDGGQNPVAEVTVEGSWSDGAAGGGTCITGASGSCSIESDSIRKRTDSVTFTVRSATHANLTYEETENVDPDGDSDGTSIVVDKS